MKKIIIAYIIIFIPLLSTALEDNYLFDNKEICMLCINEIVEEKNWRNSVCYTCKGRYGDKPGNKYFIMMKTEETLREESRLETSDNDTSKYKSSKHEFILKKQQGMDEDAVKKLCPETYSKYKK